MNYAVVGAFILLLGAALIVVVLWLASGGALQKKFDLYLAVEDESVAGLNLNAPVKYSGVDVGKVQEIQLDLANPERVRLLLAIQRGTPIKENTVAVLKTQGLTGIAYVELGGSTQDALPLKATGDEEYPVIRTKPSLSTRLETILTTVLEKLDHTTSNIDALISKDNQDALKTTLADLATITHTVAMRKDTIDKGIASASRTFNNTEQVSKQMEPLIKQMMHSAESIEKTSREAAIAINSANHTVNSVGNDVSRVTNETLPELQRLIGELSTTAGALRRLSEQTERDPASVLRGRSPVPAGPGEE